MILELLALIVTGCVVEECEQKEAEREARRQERLKSGLPPLPPQESQADIDDTYYWV